VLSNRGADKDRRACCVDDGQERRCKLLVYRYVDLCSSCAIPVSNQFDKSIVHLCRVTVSWRVKLRSRIQADEKGDRCKGLRFEYEAIIFCLPRE